VLLAGSIVQGLTQFWFQSHPEWFGGFGADGRASSSAYRESDGLVSVELAGQAVEIVLSPLGDLIEFGIGSFLGHGCPGYSGRKLWN
jgi:hypothetical protein